MFDMLIPIGHTRHLASYSVVTCTQLCGLSMDHTPVGPLLAAFKSAPCRFVTPVTYLSKRLGMSELAAWLQLESYRL